MDIDDRGGRAGRALLRETSASVDLAAARAAVGGAAAIRQRRREGALRAGVAAFVVLALTGAFLASRNPSRGDERKVATEKHETTTTVPSPPTTLSDEDRILDNMPAGPIDGRNSYRLPVEVQPSTGLVDGQTVTLYAKGFQRNDQLGVVQCTSEADVDDRGVAACDLAPPGDANPFANVQDALATKGGEVVVKVRVRRFIETPDLGRVDCRSAAERCILAIASADDYDRSGGVYLNFAGAPPFATPTLSIDPSVPTVGQPVQASITGWVAKRTIRFELCTGERCQTLLDTEATPEGTFTGAVSIPNAVIPRDDPSGTPIPCADRCDLRAVWIGLRGATSAPFPAPIRLSFAEEAPPPTVSSSTTTPTSSTATAVAPSTTSTSAVEPSTSTSTSTSTAVPTPTSSDDTGS